MWSRKARVSITPSFRHFKNRLELIVKYLYNIDLIGKFMKSVYKLFERVRLVNLPVACELQGKSGFICGKSMSHAETDCWIVWLDIPTDTHLAVSISDACIESEPSITGGSHGYLG
jgi:hypothetical protein